MKFNVTISGEARIYRHENYDEQGNKCVSFTLSWGQKKMDGTYDNAWIGVRFKKDTEPTEANTDINITNGWFKYQLDDKGHIGRVYAFVNEYSKVQAAEPTQFDGFTASEEKIPF